MQISKRLEMVASLVTSGLKVADIGTDHAYIPIYLVEKGRVKEALAMDVNRGPLLRAEENIRAHGLTRQIQTRLSDGLEALEEGEVKSIIIAGMGGPLTVRILQEGERCLTGCRELILQPQSDIRLVRTYLEEKGWNICREEMVLEDGKFYPMMRVVPGGAEKVCKAPMTQEELRFGPQLLAGCHPVLREFLIKEQRVQQKILASLSGQDSVSAEKRRREVEAELALVEAALDRYHLQHGGTEYENQPDN